jgi:hypothetical protein
MLTQEVQFIKCQEHFESMCRLIEEAGREGRRMDEIEKSLMPQLMALGRQFLQSHVDAQGEGDVGSQVEAADRTLRRSAETHARRYVSIFGELMIGRYVYFEREGQKALYVPLDAKLGMPAGDISYLLQEWQQRLCVKTPYSAATDDLKEILGTGVSVSTAEEMNRSMAESVPDFSVKREAPPADEEGELLVVTADGKGVVTRQTLKQELQDLKQASAADDAALTEQSDASEKACQSDDRTRRSVQSPSDAESKTSAKDRRRENRTRARQAAQAMKTKARKESAGENKAKPGNAKQRRNRKQMAYVGAVYTIDRFRRTPDDVLDELARRERVLERPQPQHKRVRAEMTRIHEGEPVSGREYCFASMALECDQRDPHRQKTLICLLDGEHSLWDMQGAWFARAIGILDIFHVSERVWQVAHCFHRPESAAAREFADHYLRMILEGKVVYAIRGLRQHLSEHKLSAAKRQVVNEALTYFENNKLHMKYDEYLAAGYPIGSGVAEGACRHLVKDRFELSGMRWVREQAQAMLHLRAIYLNGDWATFQSHRIATEQNTLYGKYADYAEAADYGQAA